jgi:uncharacterized protein YegP (UPF0339 family)
MGDQSMLIQGIRMPLDSNAASPCKSVAPVASRARGGCSHFAIYRAEQVHFTSVLFGGGDWHWRLTGQTGVVLAECGGYRNQHDCVAAVEALRAEAWSATVSNRSDPERHPHKAGTGDHP